MNLEDPARETAAIGQPRRASTGTAAVPFVSIVIPCRSERAFIARCLDSILRDGFPLDRLEVLVVDGRSDDGTRDVVEEYSARFPCIRLLDNPGRAVPSALNIGITRARGDVIMRMDAHAELEQGYIVGCVAALDQHDADNVGGTWRIVPRSPTAIGRAIVKALSHPFGVGNARYRLGGAARAREVDTVPWFCCRRELFRDVGLFNEKLIRGQDMEFSLRLQRQGRRTVLVPGVESRYYARSDFESFVKHNWTNGKWAILPYLHAPNRPVSWRHLVPLTFVVGAMSAVGIALVQPSMTVVPAAVVGAYGTACLLASAGVAWRERDIRYLLLLPWVFASLHVSYGLGSVAGVTRVVSSPRFWGSWWPWIHGRSASTR